MLGGVGGDLIFIRWGALKGVGKVYVQVVVDAFCSLAFANGCSRKPLWNRPPLADYSW